MPRRSPQPDKDVEQAIVDVDTRRAITRATRSHPDMEDVRGTRTYVKHDVQRSWGVNRDLIANGGSVEVLTKPKPNEGFDRELKAAVDEVLRMLKEKRYRYK